MQEKFVAESLRDLDKLIGEHLFGMKPVISPEHKGWADEEILDGEAIINRLPDFSSNIADAWTVVDLFYSASIEKQSNGDRWTAYLVTERDSMNADGFAIGDSAPIAICFAALKAKGFDIEEWSDRE